MFVSAIIPAGGAGKRMGSTIEKQFIELHNKPILAYTLDVFQKCSLISDIVVVSPENKIDLCLNSIVKKYEISKVSKVVAGGKERQDSVYNGLISLKKETDIVVIHDGVRPMINPSIIESSIKKAEEFGSAIVAVPVKDTIKRVNNYIVQETLDRSKLWIIQTPQTFKYELILKAYQEAMKDGYYATDDSALLERLGYNVSIVMGSYNNIKITTQEDLNLFEWLFNRVVN